MTEEITYPRTIEVVYIGPCKLQGGKPGAQLREHIGHNALGQEIVFERKNFKHDLPGAIYEIEQAAANSFRLSGKRYSRMFGDKAQIAAWQIAAKSLELREEADKAEKSMKSLPAALELLEPLRAEYKKALPDRRRVIEILLLDYLRR